MLSDNGKVATLMRSIAIAANETLAVVRANGALHGIAAQSKFLVALVE